MAHASVLNKSPTLQKIIDGDWKDSKDLAIDFEEWDETAISQLLDYLYTGQYKLIIIIPQPISNKGFEVEWMVVDRCRSRSKVENVLLANYARL